MEVLEDQWSTCDRLLEDYWCLESWTLKCLDDFDEAHAAGDLEAAAKALQEIRKACGGSIGYTQFEPDASRQAPV